MSRGLVFTGHNVKVCWYCFKTKYVVFLQLFLAYFISSCCMPTCSSTFSKTEEKMFAAEACQFISSQSTEWQEWLCVKQRKHSHKRLGNILPFILHLVHFLSSSGAH